MPVSGRDGLAALKSIPVAAIFSLARDAALDIGNYPNNKEYNHRDSYYDPKSAIENKFITARTTAPTIPPRQCIGRGAQHCNQSCREYHRQGDARSAGRGMKRRGMGMLMLFGDLHPALGRNGVRNRL
jgi:hypothetical protein